MKKITKIFITAIVLFLSVNVLADKEPKPFLNSNVATNQLKKAQLVVNVINIAKNIFNNPVSQKMINGSRTIFLNFMPRSAEQNLQFMKNQYLALMRNADSSQGAVLWGGHLELTAIAEKYFVCINVIDVDANGKETLVEPIGDLSAPKITIRLQGNHYKYINSNGELVDVPSDGNCMFNAVLWAAASNKITNITPNNVADLREQVVDFLQEHPGLMEAFSPDEVIDGVHKIKDLVNIIAIPASIPDLSDLAKTVEKNTEKSVANKVNGDEGISNFNNPPKNVEKIKGKNGEKKADNFQLDLNKIKSNFKKNNNILDKANYYNFKKSGMNNIEINFSEEGMEKTIIISRYKLGKLIVKMDNEYANYLREGKGLSVDDIFLSGALKVSELVQAKDNSESQGCKLFNKFSSEIVKLKDDLIDSDLKSKALDKYTNTNEHKKLQAFFNSQSYMRGRGLRIYKKYPNITYANFMEKTYLTDEDKSCLMVYFQATISDWNLGKQAYNKDRELFGKLVRKKAVGNLSEAEQKQLNYLRLYLVDKYTELHNMLGNTEDVVPDVSDEQIIRDEQVINNILMGINNIETNELSFCATQENNKAHINNVDDNNNIIELIRKVMGEEEYHGARIGHESIDDDDFLDDSDIQ